MSITPATKLFAVIGDPVSHSLSPTMFNAAFESLGMDAVYLGLRVSPQSLSDAIRGIKACGFAGVNVTLPHKKAVMELLDELDSPAKQTGAVNTILNSGGTLKGFNTDVNGFRRAAHKLVGGTKGKRVVILGAGGAASAVLQAAGDAREVTMLTRSPERVHEPPIEVLSPHSMLQLTAENLENPVSEADILVNATPVGLSTEESLVPRKMLHPNLAVMDLIYRKGGTLLVRDALSAGCKAIGGEEMLLGQGMAAFEIFTGTAAPERVMRTALEESL